MNDPRKIRLPACGFALVTAVLTALAADRPASAPTSTTLSWRDDPIWRDGKAEWALYDAVRPIYGKERRYEATIFTDREMIDPKTTTKADVTLPGSLPGIEVFKHNVSEMIPTENYTYRYLTTVWVRSDNLQPYKLTMSSQEDCGATYKQFVVDGSTVKWRSFCYFPGAGDKAKDYARPGQPEHYQFQDALSLTLRDYPFDAPQKPVLNMKIVPDQTDTHETEHMAEEATVTWLGRETVQLPIGSIVADHLRVELVRDRGENPGASTDYWFAAEPSMRRVMVKYNGPFGVKYELKKLARWAYWKDPRPE